MKKAVFLYDYTGIMAEPWLKAGYECWILDGQHNPGIHREGNLVKVGIWFDPYEVESQADNIKAMIGDACFVFGFPECTDLAVSGAAHFAKKRENNPLFQQEATDLAKLVEVLANKFKCPWGAENPVSVLSTLWRKPDFNFHPWEYGGYLPVDDIHPTYPEYIKPRDAYPKKTCIWHGNGFNEPLLKSVGPTGHDLVKGKAHPVLVRILKTIVKNDEGKFYKWDGTPIWGHSDQHKKLGGKSLKTKNIRSATPRGFANAVFLANR